MRKRNTKWTPLMDEYIIRSREKGECLRPVASAIGCSPDAVANRYRRLCEWKGIPRINLMKVKAELRGQPT